MSIIDSRDFPPCGGSSIFILMAAVEIGSMRCSPRQLLFSFISHLHQVAFRFMLIPRWKFTWCDASVLNGGKCYARRSAEVSEMLT